MENKSWVDIIKPEQIKYNIAVAKGGRQTKEANKKHAEDWAKAFLTANEFELDELQMKEFINYVVYGR